MDADTSAFGPVFQRSVRLVPGGRRVLALLSSVRRVSAGGPAVLALLCVRQVCAWLAACRRCSPNPPGWCRGVRRVLALNFAVCQVGAGRRRVLALIPAIVRLVPGVTSGYWRCLQRSLIFRFRFANDDGGR